MDLAKGQACRTAFTSAPCLDGFSISPAELLASRPDVHNLIAGAMIFRSSPKGPVVQPTDLETLVLQRAPTDCFPLKWEIPAGTADPSVDFSIFEVAARELWEETGLRARRFLRSVGLGLSGDVTHIVCKGEAEGACMDLDLDMCLVQVSGLIWAVVTFITEIDESIQEVALQPDEHVAWSWVTEDEVRKGEFASESGEGLDLVSEAMKMTILEGFRLRKEMAAG